MRTVEVTEKVVFLQIGLSRMGDKRGVSSDDIEVDADKELVKARKIIFKSPAFDRIKSLDSEIRRYVRVQCFPFESGLHMIPARLVDDVNYHLKQYHQLRFNRINDFAEQWPIIKNEFSDKLRKLYNIEDYEVGDIHSNFSMSWNFIELKSPVDISEIPEAILKEEQKKFRDRMEEAYEEARMILRETCFAMVTHLRTSLESDAHGAAKRISSATITKLQEFLRTFDLRNITNDEVMQDHVKELSMILQNTSADSIRNRPDYRHRIRFELSLVEEQLKEAITVLPTRRIKGI